LQEQALIELADHPDGVVLPVRAQPGARRSGIQGEQAGMLKVAVTAAPEKGKANKAIIEVLSQELSVRKSQFELISGDTAQQKRILVRGVTMALLREKLAERLGPGA
jgi:uncharacterized protein